MELLSYMSKGPDTVYTPIIESIRKIQNDNNFTGTAMAEFLGITKGQYSKFLQGEVGLKIPQVAKLATSLKMNIIDVFTYPDVYINEKLTDNPERISVTFEVSPDKRDILLNLVTRKSENNR